MKMSISHISVRTLATHYLLTNTLVFYAHS